MKTLFKASIFAAFIAAFFMPIAGPAEAQFAQQATWGGTGAGTANAQTITLGNVGSMADLRGVTISWMVGSGLTNTGPATLSINGLTAVNVERMANGALAQLGGYEMPAGLMVQATYDGTELILITDYTGGGPVGSTKIANYSVADPGYLLEYGQCIPQANYPALYAKISTTYNTVDGCSGANFGLPDLRGRMPAGLDNMGGTTAGRITVAGGTIDGTILGNSWNQQSKVVAQANLAYFTMPGSMSGTMSGSMTGTMTGTGDFQYGVAGGGAGAINFVYNVGSGAYTQNIPLSVSGTVSGTVSGSVSGSVNSGGSSTPLPTLSNTQIVIYEIKY